MYFFTPRDKKYKNGQRPKRTTPDGYWKATGADKIILHNGEAVGCDKSLVFYWRKPPCGVKTSWLMHEFRVNNLPPRQRTHEDDMRLDDWVLCKIYNNSEKKSNNNSTKRKRDDDRYDQIQETNNNTNQEVEPTADGSSKNVEQEDLWGFNKLETMLISDTFLGNGVDIMKDYDNLNYQNFYNPDYIYVDESILLNQNAGTYTNLVPTSMVPPNFLMGGYDYNSQNPVAYEPGLTELYDELPEIPTIDELLGSITARHEPVPTGQHEELPEILTMDINELLDSITCGHEPVPTGQVHEENNCGIPEMDNRFYRSPTMESNPVQTESIDALINPIYISPNLSLDDDYLSSLTDDEYFESLPPGFRFVPRDEELIVQYLNKKIRNEKLPRNKINVLNLYEFNPEQLSKYTSTRANEWYFLTPRDRKYKNGKRPNRAANGGYWKATGADKQIEQKGETIGYQKALVFYKGKPPNGQKTCWTMQEYRVNNPSTHERNGEDDMRVYQKVAKSNNTTRNQIQEPNNNTDQAAAGKDGSINNVIQFPDVDCVPPNQNADIYSNLTPITMVSSISSVIPDHSSYVPVSMGQHQELPGIPTLDSNEFWDLDSFMNVENKHDDYSPLFKPPSPNNSG
ncbi:NAC domain transcriptional regulator superfamily protein [Abeliophyllum distichum]|uniref:NAC domain transcriptional regulator superfamily protein n=1 Tax=Abeliophyllum distichum TaxID=126358 RepID=A0ABD1TJG2_9LAMI